MFKTLFCTFQTELSKSKTELSKSKSGKNLIFHKWIMKNLTKTLNFFYISLKDRAAFSFMGQQ